MMEISTIIAWVELIFTIIGIVVVGGSIIVRITPGDKDDNWWNTWVLKYVPAILPGDLAHKITGKGAVNRKVLLSLVRKAHQTFKNLKKETK
jgi:hypothetical protein